MRQPARILIALCSTMALLASTPVNAQAKTYPDRPIRLIVPFPPGGNTDLLGRLVAQKLSDRLGTAVVVDNRAGAGSQIGIETASKAAPDGYTLLFGPADGMSILPALRSKLPYDPIKDFVPVARIATSPFVYSVNSKLSVDSLETFLAEARKKPGTIRYGTPGIGSIAHLAMELLQSRTGTQFSHIPYKGGGPALAGFLAGDTEAMVSSQALIRVPAQAGQVHMLAQTGPDRHPSMAAVPTTKEAHIADVEVVSWFGLFAPSGTPTDVVERLTKISSDISRDADFAKRMIDTGSVAAYLAPAEFGEFVAQDIRKWAGVVKAAGIEVDY
mgnify:CR=1 FL=1